MDERTTLVRQLMTRDPTRIDPHDPIQLAAQRMKSASVGFLVVYAPPAGVVGVITDRDITVRATAEGRDPATTEVRETMTAQVVTCYDDSALEDAAEIMERHALRRLVVVTRAHELIGVLSVDDVAQALGGERLAGDVLHHASRPT
jgi:CBS domain-containing protein